MRGEEGGKRELLFLGSFTNGVSQGKQDSAPQVQPLRKYGDTERWGVTGAGKAGEGVDTELVPVLLACN